MNVYHVDNGECYSDAQAWFIIADSKEEAIQLFIGDSGRELIGTETRDNVEYITFTYQWSEGGFPWYYPIACIGPVAKGVY